ncbi:hypothetical protein PTRG_04306 [Pyrenophora tritici-repentis Pt-1C-BFP]|uniref:Uncharacterized protein n=1 Tax=Pyrenophora tritici-repentis (strain Pt-1C-BFP) TaxID=426418 RepID=B2W1H1_PYRTR|nr:uncharacterized protein PTRG_04306 [Pyrenophora tritici-repentis Pt-1C-BFP]EDU47144.1 hypothetical protein PTRG_04306 [Pyrenophora tritici-repentis Pt-1C-BFP]
MLSQVQRGGSSQRWRSAIGVMAHTDGTGKPSCGKDQGITPSIAASHSVHSVPVPVCPFLPLPQIKISGGRRRLTRVGVTRPNTTYIAVMGFTGSQGKWARAFYLQRRTWSANDPILWTRSFGLFGLLGQRTGYLEGKGLGPGAVEGGLTTIIGRVRGIFFFRQN